MGETGGAADPHDAWRRFCRRLEALGDAIVGDEFPQTPRDRAEGFRYLTRLIPYATRMEIEAGDPRHPRFVRYETPDCQWGGPNPDNTYLRARVDPRERYRVSADVRGVRQAIFSLHDGDMQQQRYGVYAETSLDRLEVGADGRLEIVVSADEVAGNWMPMPPEATIFCIRVYVSDWAADASPPFHIERIGGEGEPAPPPTPERIAEGLDRAASWLEATGTYWNAYMRAGLARATPNVPAPPAPAKGGASDILYGSCFWDLADDEALLVECDVPDADYWGFTIHTPAWFESGDFASRQTSLSGHQTFVDDDRRLRIAVAHRDPGVPNWIDTEARSRGLLLYRWVFTRDAPAPTARVVPVAEVAAAMPAGHPTVDEATRRRQLARRREEAWSRFL